MAAASTSAAAGTITAAPQITSTFNPAARCTSLYYNSQGIISLGQSEAASVSACFPSGWASTSDNYLSGSICPSGYAFAESTTLGGVTAGTCCPSLYSTVSGNLAQNPFFTGMYCTSEFSSRTTIRVTTTNSFGSYVPQQLTIIDGDGINAFGISLRWSDQTSTSSSSTSSTSTTSTTSAPATSTAAASTSSGLSSGAKAGIGVGVAVGVLAILGILAFIIITRRRHQSQNPNANTGVHSGAAGAASPYHNGQDTHLSEMGSPEQKYSTTGSPGVPTEYYAPGTNGGYAPVQQQPVYNQQPVMHEMPADSTVHR